MIGPYPTPLSSRRQGRWNRILIAIFGILIAYCVTCYVLVLASIPVYYQRVVSGTVPTVILNGNTMTSNAQVTADAAARAMTLPVYAIYSAALNLAVAAGFLAAGALILWKAQGDWFRWLAAFVLIFFPLGTLQTLAQVSGYGSSWVMLGAILWPTFLLFLYLFPNGRAAPRWTRWPMGVILYVHLAIQVVAAAASIWTLPAGTVQKASSLAVFILIGFVLILFCQIYRYRVVSTPIERAQIKWFVAGLALLVVESVAGSLLTGTVLASGHGFVSDLSNVLSLVIPASITISILRYRLWDIDVIIRKTLVYSVLTVLLALVYFGTVVLLQRLFSTLTGVQQSPLAVVVSTLVIAALFTPLRRRIQDAIDRRFYRKKYDAQRVLAQFALTARDETDLDVLTSELTRVVQETLHLEGVSVWLKESASVQGRR
jgi:hypothetical protein